MSILINSDKFESDCYHNEGKTETIEIYINYKF